MGYNSDSNITSLLNYLDMSNISGKLMIKESEITSDNLVFYLETGDTVTVPIDELVDTYVEETYYSDDPVIFKKDGKLLVGVIVYSYINQIDDTLWYYIYICNNTEEITKDTYTDVYYENVVCKLEEYQSKLCKKALQDTEEVSVKYYKL